MEDRLAPATLVTDAFDYAFGSTAAITGSGFRAGEAVRLQVLHAPGTPGSNADAQNQPWQITADAGGGFTARWVVDDPDAVGATYDVSAVGLTSGLIAGNRFTDGGPFSYTPATANLTVAPGSTVSFTQTVTAPAGNGTFTATLKTPVGTGPNSIPGSWVSTSVGSLTFNTTAGAGDSKSWTVTFTVPAGTAAGTYTGVIQLDPPRQTVGVGPGTDVSLTVSAANTAPAVASNNGSVTVTEGQTAANTGTWSDVNAGDTVTLTASIGTVTKSGANAGGTWSWSYGTSDGPAGPTTVTITADDGHGGISIATFALNVNNVPPTVTAPADQAATEGAATGFDLGSFADPGADDAPWAVDVDWGDSSHTTFNAAAPGSLDTRSHTYADDGTYTVTVAVKDKDSALSSNQFTITVANVAPTAVLATGGVTYGTALTAGLGSPFDPSPADADAGFRYAFGYATTDTSPLTGPTTTTASADFGTLDAGTYYVFARIFDDDGGFTEYSQQVVVSPRAVTVTADARTKVYGDADPALTYQVTAGSLVPGDGFTGALTRTAGETVLGGPYAILQGDLTAGPNYALTYVGADLEITPRAASVTPDAAGKVYGDADPALTGALAGFLAGDGVTATYSRTAGETVSGGPYTIGATLSPAGVLSNYAVTYHTAAFTISPRLATVTANDKAKTYGDANPALDATVVGTVNGDVLAYALSTPAGQFSNAGTYAIAVILGSNPNYSVTAVDGTLTIARANQTITWANPAAVLTGTELGATQLNATVAGVFGGSAPGALSYAPDAGTALVAGTQTLTVTAAETENYTAASATVTIAVYDPARISGVAFKDFNHDGEVDYGEEGVAGVVVTLSGFDLNGTPVSASVQTDGSGYYSFGNLLPGSYTVSFDSENDWTLGPSIQSDYTISFSKVGTGGGTSATNNFALVPAAGDQLKKGQTAGIGFWQNKNGQALILKMNGSAGSTLLGNWLANNFPNMFGNLAGKDNACVAACYRAVFATKGDKTEAQFFATALSLYVTSSCLSGGTYAAAYGFTVDWDGARITIFNVGSCGAVVGESNNETMTLMDILLALDSQAKCASPTSTTGVGTLFVGNQPTRSMATALLTAINEWGNIG